MALGGKLEVIVPDLSQIIARLAKQDDIFSTPETRLLPINIYGCQQECDPSLATYNSNYWDVHKSGYTLSTLKQIVADAGFSDITVTHINGDRLRATATKNVNAGERQVAGSLKGIRSDHIKRYQLAAEELAHLQGNIGDMACGVGYGTWLLGDLLKSCLIVGIDRDASAINYALSNYSGIGNVSYRTADLNNNQLFLPEYFSAVISFETIEHIPFAATFVESVYKSLKPRGIFICSSPNESRMPFSAECFPYHIRHFRPNEFEKLLEDAGFMIRARYTQMDNNPGEITTGWNGLYNIAVCER